MYELFFFHNVALSILEDILSENRFMLSITNLLYSAPHNIFFQNNQSEQCIYHQIHIDFRLNILMENFTVHKIEVEIHCQCSDWMIFR